MDNDKQAPSEKTRREDAQPENGAVAVQHSVTGAPGTGPSATRPPLVTALTGVRALAIVAVLVYHLREATTQLFDAVRVAEPLTLFAFLGVDLFFLLSGFIISYNYAVRLSSLDRRACSSFLVSRFARLYPVHLVTLVATAALVGWFALRGTVFDATPHTVGGFLGNLLMLQALPGMPAWNTPSWSICCEAGAYLAFPLIAGFLYRIRPVTAAILAMVLVGSLVVAIRMIVVGPVVPALPFYWLRLVIEFSLGCLMWAIWKRGFQPHWRWDVIATSALAMALLVIYTQGSSARTWVAIGFLAVFVMATANATGIVQSILASRPFEWMGRVSYSVYLVHYPVLFVLMRLLPTSELSASSSPTRALVLAAYFLTPVALGAVMYYLVEEPARTWIRGRISRRSRAAVPTPSRVG